jgi:hypothetical protein
MNKLGELIEACQDDIADTKGVEAKKLISVKEWTRFANAMEIEACRRAYLIKDSTTLAICRVEAQALNPVLRLDDRVILVNRVATFAEGYILQKTRLDLMDKMHGGAWESDNDSQPTDWLEGMDTGAIRLYPCPSEAITLRLTVTRQPLLPMARQTDTFEINSRYFEALVAGMLSMAYAKQDVEIVNDLPRSMQKLAVFTEEFGPKRSARTEQFASEYLGLDPFEGQV